MANRRKLENAALALSVFGVILLLPPILSIFNIETRLFGAPLVVIYLFGIWLLLIVATFFLSSFISNSDINATSKEDEIKGNKTTESKN